MRQRGDDAAEQVKEDVTPVPETILDVVTENPERQHIAEEMHPASMQEHGREDRWNRKRNRDEAVGLDERVERGRRLRDQRELVKKNEAIDGDQADRGDGDGLRRDDIADWQHAGSIIPAS